MGRQHPALEPLERDLAAAQLDRIGSAFEGAPTDSWKEAVLQWHLQALADARAEAWIPGLADSNDTAVEAVLARFYRHQMRTTIGRLKAENLMLRRKLLDAAACAPFSASHVVEAKLHGGRPPR